MADDVTAQRIHVDGHEDVALRAVRQAGALAQRDHAIISARHHDFETALLQKGLQAALDVERDLLFGETRCR